MLRTHCATSDQPGFQTSQPGQLSTKFRSMHKVLLEFGQKLQRLSRVRSALCTDAESLYIWWKIQFIDIVLYPLCLPRAGWKVTIAVDNLSFGKIAKEKKNFFIAEIKLVNNSNPMKHVQKFFIIKIPSKNR